jgi:hypothetical protein
MGEAAMNRFEFENWFEEFKRPLKMSFMRCHDFDVMICEGKEHGAEEVGCILC